jgi:hypothetical protein
VGLVLYICIYVVVREMRIAVPMGYTDDLYCCIQSVYKVTTFDLI